MYICLGYYSNPRIVIIILFFTKASCFKLVVKIDPTTSETSEKYMCRGNNMLCSPTTKPTVTITRFLKAHNKRFHFRKKNY